MKTQEVSEETKDQVIQAAIRWWESHRPVDWSVKEHLENPEVNAGQTGPSARLAEAVAKFVREGQGFRSRI